MAARSDPNLSMSERILKDLEETYVGSVGGEAGSDDAGSSAESSVGDVQLTTGYGADQYMTTSAAVRKQRRRDKELRRKREELGLGLINYVSEGVRLSETEADYATPVGSEETTGDEDGGYDVDAEPERDGYDASRHDDAEHNMLEDYVEDTGEDESEDEEYVIDEFTTSKGTWTKKQDEDGREQYLKNGAPLVDYGEGEDTWKEQLERARQAYRTAKTHKLPGEDE